MLVPPHTIRISKRAKHLQLKISTSGLEVIVPHGQKHKLSQSNIDAFIARKKSWIIEHYARFSSIPLESPKLPHEVMLHAIDEVWRVSYVQSIERLSLYESVDRELIVTGDLTNTRVCLHLLRAWLKRKAELILHPLFHEIACEKQIEYARCSIKFNKTRWGSCSREGNINLCAKLLLLPLSLVKHVMLHELSHTRFMHHGHDFWNFLEKLDPNTKIHAKALRMHAKHLPAWLLLS